MLWVAITIYLVCMNLVSFAAMGLDKRWAKMEQHQRIPELRLFLTALLGGSLGSILGMQIFRHKTRHWYFRLGMPLILLLQIGLGLWLCWKFGVFA